MRTETSVQINKVYYSDKRDKGNTCGGVTEKDWNEGGGQATLERVCREGLRW